MKTATIQARISPQTKECAEKILHQLGITSSDVINMLFAQIVIKKAVPFQIDLQSHINETTKKVFEDTDKNKNLISYSNSDESFKALDI